MPTATSEVRTLLVIAAEQFELRHIRPPALQRWILKANGPGPELARKAAAEEVVSQQVDAVVSLGICGALVEDLHVGDIVVGSSINGVTIDVPRTKARCVIGPVASMDRVAQTVAEKQSLRETGAIAVEMEAAGLLECAQEWGVPFYCVRAVSDVATEGFALDLNAARDASGRFRAGHILAQAIRRPLAGVPELFRLKRNSEVAAKALGEFIGNCSF